MSFKISLRAARVNANMNLVPAAKAIGVGKDKLLKWEKNSGLVPPVWQKKIAEVYKIPPDAIFYGI